MAFDELSIRAQDLLFKLLEAHTSGKYSPQFYVTHEEDWIIHLAGVNGNEDKTLSGFTEGDLIALETNQYLTPNPKQSGHALSLSHKAFEHLHLSREASRLKSLNTVESEPINPLPTKPQDSQSSGGDKQSFHLAHANELYNKVKDLIQNVGTLDESTARLIVELADDAIKDFGNTNQEKKVELRRIREEAEEALPPKTIEELRKRAEGKTLKRTYPKTKTGRLLVAIIIIVVTALGILYGWYSAIKPSPDKQALTSSTPQSQSKSEATTELALRYYLTIQKTEDGRDIGDPFNSSGREGLGSGWKFRLNFSSPQQGFLYLLYENLESQKPEFILLFPTIVEASAQLSANEKYSLPASNNEWYFITGDSTKDRVWVIWSAKTLPELDAIKGRAAKLENLGEINEPFDVYPILRLIENAAKTPPELDSDTRTGITGLRVKSDILLFPIDITHTK